MEKREKKSKLDTIVQGRFCGKYSQNMTEVSLPVAGVNLYRQ